jgi:hypothetical protein
MKKHNTVVLAMLVGIFSPLDAFAYLDPGAGSMLLQVIIWGLAAIGVVLKLYWHRFLQFLGIRKDSPKKVKGEASEQVKIKTEDK